MSLATEIIVSEIKKEKIDSKFKELVELADEINSELTDYIEQLDGMTSKYIDKNLSPDAEVIVKDIIKMQERFIEMKEFNEKVYDFFFGADHKVTL